MTDTEVFKALPIEAKKRGIVPKIKIGKKSTFWYHAVFNFFLNIIYPKDRKDAYLTNYWTTIGYSIAWPDKWGETPARWQTMTHELKHAAQAKKWTRPVFSFFYLWPLSQGALLALLGWIPLIWVPGWWKLLYAVLWLVIAGIHFIPQLPDPWRTHWEKQAYLISLYFHIQKYKTMQSWYLKNMVYNYTSMAYFMMEPRQDKIRTFFERAAAEIEKGVHPVKDEPLVKLVEEMRAG